jgi:lipoprotein-anchoring transpeptidase ErfK/SrfK
LALAGCATTESVRQQGGSTLQLQARLAQFPPEPALGTVAEIYAARVDDGFALPAIPYERIDPRSAARSFRTRRVSRRTPSSSISPTTSSILSGPTAKRSATASGSAREGFAWSGRAIVEWKQHWPRWFPPEEMIARRPELAKYKAVQVPGKNEWEGGQPGGLDNPLGARAMYLFQDGKDTLFRLHGSPEWDSIGKSVSSGCVRLINQDVIDLYDRVPDKAPVLVTTEMPLV